MIIHKKEVSAMNDYSSLRNKKKSHFSVIVALALCVALSASLLFGRLTAYSVQQTHQYIPLTVSNGVTKVTTSQRKLAAPRVQQPRVALLSATNQEPVAPVTENEPQQTETAWLTMTELELFCVSYENGEGEVTVKSGNGDKVIAPGTSHSFIFSLQNTADTGLDYQMEVEAYFAIEGGNENIPVELRLRDYNGNYLIGTAHEFEDLSDVNVATGSGSISAGYIAPYTIEWQWPFESGDDAYDTAIGNYFLETEVEVTFVMEVRTYAVQGGEGGIEPPNTGDDGIVLATATMCGSVIALLFLIPWKRKREDEDVPTEE